MEHSIEESELNLSEALGRLGGDLTLFRELGGIFLEEAPKLLQNLKNAVHSRDFKEIEISAHSLKGSVSNFSSKQTYQLALALEKKGRAHDGSGTIELFSALEQAFERLSGELLALSRQT